MGKMLLTLKAPVTTAADDFHKYTFIVFSEKIRPAVSCESSAWHKKSNLIFFER